MKSMTPMEWLMGGDTGISSKTILSAMTGTPMTGGFGPDIPGDGVDFGRCYRLLKLFPEWRANLSKVSDAYPQWTPLVREWDSLEKAYEEDLGKRHGKDSCYAMLRALYDKCMIAGGWQKSGNGGWKRDKTSVVQLGKGVSMRFGA